MLAILLVGILISVYFNYSLSEKNKELKISYINLKENYITLQNNFQILINQYKTVEGKNIELTHEIEIVDESLQELKCDVGRRGIFWCTPPGGWKRCFDSFEDDNPGDKSKECCKAMPGGEWHEKKCCAPDRKNAGWEGTTGYCTNEGNWAVRR